jgi:hypothetical protein
MAAMRKQAFFDDHWGKGWPDLKIMEACFLDPVRRAQLFARERDGGSFFVETGSPDSTASEVKSALYLHMNADHGVKLVYSRWDGRIQRKDDYDSKGDLTRLREFVRSFHDTPLSAGLFIPFERGWNAVKEFMQTDGELPKSIEWIANSELPPGTFPDP